jgi:hypothetical protein
MEPLKGIGEVVEWSATRKANSSSSSIPTWGVLDLLLEALGSNVSDRLEPREKSDSLELALSTKSCSKDAVFLLPIGIFVGCSSSSLLD